ncbi:hypothetical protein JZ751_000515 [Albula glossodonta]|uniref:Uncharacterized protein n=1 Tax=Albula glossodonta TaxID=121402 RepID=A0A8T2PW49_9TELE|nr:hypothetical protein JZ751_000515 [Albula glossodonta]
MTGKSVKDIDRYQTEENKFCADCQAKAKPRVLRKSTASPLARFNLSPHHPPCLTDTALSLKCHAECGQIKARFGVFRVCDGTFCMLQPLRAIFKSDRRLCTNLLLRLLSPSVDRRFFMLSSETGTGPEALKIQAWKKIQPCIFNVYMSPDLNPIENLSDVLKRRLHKHGPQNLKDMERFCMDEWSQTACHHECQLTPSMLGDMGFLYARNQLAVDVDNSTSQVLQMDGGQGTGTVIGSSLSESQLGMMRGTLQKLNACGHGLSLLDRVVRACPRKLELIAVLAQFSQSLSLRGEVCCETPCSTCFGTE